MTSVHFCEQRRPTYILLNSSERVNSALGGIAASHNTYLLSPVLEEINGLFLPLLCLYEDTRSVFVLDDFSTDLHCKIAMDK